MLHGDVGKYQNVIENDRSAHAAGPYLVFAIRYRRGERRAVLRRSFGDVAASSSINRYHTFRLYQWQCTFDELGYVQASDETVMCRSVVSINSSHVSCV